MILWHDKNSNTGTSSSITLCHCKRSDMDILSDNNCHGKRSNIDTVSSTDSLAWKKVQNGQCV